MRRSHSLTWRVSRAIESAGASRPLVRRTGPAWVFGIGGIIIELVMAPTILLITIGVGVASYLILDAPWTKVRAQQRPRFVSVRILYLNTLILVGFWLAVMFIFSAADPAVSGGVEQRLPALLEIASTKDLRSLVQLKRSAGVQPVRDPVESAATWFDVFLQGVGSAMSLNFVLYGIVIARRRSRARTHVRSTPRKSLRYDASLGLFVDEPPASPH